MSGPNFFIGNNSWFTFYDSENEPLPNRRCDGSALKPSDTLLDIRSGTIRQYRVNSPPGFTGWQAAGVLGDSNGDAVNFGEEVEFAVIDQQETATAYPTFSWKCLSGGNVITKFCVTMHNNELLFKQGDVTGPTIMTFQANGNVLFANNVTVTGDLFADDVAYDEALINILRVEDRIEHNGNATNKITFETNKMTLDASGTSIVLDDDAMTDKIVINGQTKFTNNIDNVPDIYLQNHIHHSGDVNTRIGFPANDQIALRTGGTDRLTITDTQTTSSNNIVVSSTGGIILNPGSNAGSAVIERSGIITNNVQGFSPYTSNISGASGGGCQISMNNTSIVCSTFPSTTNVGDPVTLTERMRLNATGLGIATPTPAYPLDVNGSAKFTTIRDSANSVGTAGQVLSSTGSGLSWIPAGGSIPMAILRETTAFGVNSTITFPTAANSRVSRNINDIQYNTLGITVAAPNFTLPNSGTYQIDATANFALQWPNSTNNTGSMTSRLYLRNETLNLNEVLIGLSCWGEQQQYDINNLVQPCQGVATLRGVFTNTGSNVYSLQQIVNQVFRYGSVAGTKYGGSAVATGTTNPEYYVNICITKLA